MCGALQLASAVAVDQTSQEQQCRLDGQQACRHVDNGIQPASHLWESWPVHLQAAACRDICHCFLPGSQMPTSTAS